MLRLTWQGMETGYGRDIETLSKAAGSNRQAQPKSQAPFLDPTTVLRCECIVAKRIQGIMWG